MDIKNLKIGILGMARSGIAAARKIKELGGNIFISEFKAADKIPDAAAIQAEFSCEFGGHTERILDNDILIVSPGIPLSVPIVKEAKKRGLELISEIEFGFRIKHPDSKIIAITGSNGKSTTVTLIHHILQTAGYNSILAGNIGTAFTAYPIEKPGIDFIVLELSSFQLELIDTFRPDVAAVLNITPDHLNRYKNMEEYAQAKFNIFRNQTHTDLAIINSNDHFAQDFRSQIPAEIKQFGLQGKSDITLENNSLKYQDCEYSLKDATLKGPHNIENMMASIMAVNHFHLPAKAIITALSTFVSLPHRLEFVAEIEGVKFYNDSKATNTDAVKYAVQSFDLPILLIMGGAGKGEDYSVLNDYLKKHVKKLFLVGASKEEMAEVFAGIVDLQVFDTFEAVVSASFLQAKPGDTVVLSPACTSYDLFNNFEERGDYFKKLVKDLKK